MNMEKEVFKNHPGIREAISLSIDRDGISKIIYEDLVTPACGILPPGILVSQNDTLCKTRNLQKAKQLLAQEGFEKGATLPELTLLYNNKEMENRLWQFVKANLEEAGFKIKLKSLEWGAYLEAVRAGECDLFRGSWVADYPDPHNFLFILFYSQNAGSAGNYSRYKNPDYDEMVENAKTEINDSLRILLYRQAENMIKKDLPVCPLFFGGDAVLLKKEWEGFIPSAQGVWATPLNLLKKK
jgi:peptide/nickel transport system substrate-binding protein/oligopeptide transport system substrate-binding protein